MYKPIKDGRVETIYGIDCWIPPPPPKEEIANYYLPKKEQKWRRNELPTFKPRDIDIWTGTLYEPGDVLDWDMARREEVAKQTGTDPWDVDRYGDPKKIDGLRADLKYVSEPLANFRNPELDRCDPWDGGYWFFSNGNPVWLTPFHYFYLNWWEINVGYPEYRDTDRQIFYLWQWVFENPNCYGLCEVAKRGGGKTYRALAVLYLRTIYGRNILSGIQSKTDDDSKDMFILKLVECYKNLPDFLIPINSNPTDPKTELRFFAKSKRGKSSMFHRLLQRKAIRSTINFKNAQPKAYDGQTINGVLVRDEEGKTIKSVCDVNERHRVTRNCVFRDGKMFGKIYSTTTLDKMDKGGEQFKVIWDGSNQFKVPEGLDPADTASGMIRVFFPAYRTEFFDEYGMPDAVKGRDRQQKERDKLVNDPGSLIMEILQYPWNERELFMSSGNSCQYDLNTLRLREQVVLDPDYNKVRVGDFYLENGNWGDKVRWRDNPDNGMWHVGYLFEDYSRDANKFKVKRSSTGDFTFIPENLGRFSGGFDPTKTGRQVDKRRSSAAGTIFMHEDVWRPEISNTWIADFVQEPLDPVEAWLNFLIGCMYYGCQYLPESNLGVPEELTKIGAGEFIMWRPENTFTTNNRSQHLPGLPSSENMNAYMIRRKQTHVVHHGHKMILPRVIRQSIEFDPEFRTKYDVEVASQLSLIASEKPVAPPPVEINATELVRVWDNSGRIGKIV